MIILFDTCIILDFLLDRNDFSNDAQTLIDYAAEERIIGLLTSKSVADIHYVLKHSLHDENKVRNIISELLDTFQLLDTSAQATISSLKSNINDFEDALMVEVADLYLVDGIVTRNTKDFKKSKVKIYTPKELIKAIQK